ncbi:MAG: hypothetical protein V3V84_07640 [Candidatus Bathyarchaeia archaeon]
MALQIPSFRIPSRQLVPSAAGLGEGIGQFIGGIREERKLEQQKTEQQQRETEQQRKLTEASQLSQIISEGDPERRTALLSSFAERAQPQFKDELSQFSQLPFEQQDAIGRASLTEDGFERLIPKAEKGDQFTLGPGQKRFTQAGKEIAAVGEESEQEKIIPQTLLEGLSPGLAEKASAAFTAAGGGTDGLKAVTTIVDKGTEQERRANSPALLGESFPQASTAELNQLQGVMDSAKTTESGLKEAGKVREAQRRDKKAKVFQSRSIALIDKILENPELDDVVGGIEGRRGGAGDTSLIPALLSDQESNAIADIEEAQNILTADNMNLMAGVLSESDIKILANLAGGALNRTRGEERFRADLIKLRDKLSAQQVSTIDDRGAGAANGGAKQTIRFDAQGNIIQ